MLPFEDYRKSLGIFLLAFIFLFLKSPDALLHPQFWAEDGPVFFAPQALTPWPLLATPYAGYLHVTPRIVAWLASAFKVLQAPLIYNLSAILIDAACITFVCLRFSLWFPFWAIFASFFIVPTAGDIFGTATNVQWFLQFTLTAACFLPSQSTRILPRSARLASFFALAVAAMSGPFSILVAVPVTLIIIFNAYFDRISVRKPEIFSGTFSVIKMIGSSISKTNLCIISAGAAVQILVLATNKARTPVEMFLLNQDQQNKLGVAGLRSFYGYTVNHPFTAFHLVVALIIFGIALSCLVLAFRRPSAPTWIGCLLLANGTVQPILAFLKQREVHTLAVTSHYFYMLSVVTVWIGWKIFSDLVPQWKVHAAIGASACFILVASLRPDYFRREPLHDLNWAMHAELLGRSPKPRVLVPINPVPWSFNSSLR